MTLVCNPVVKLRSVKHTSIVATASNTVRRMLVFYVHNSFSKHTAVPTHCNLRAPALTPWQVYRLEAEQCPVWQ